REQDVGSSQINQAIQQLDKVTQQNASASEQVSATSEELAAQAEALQAAIAYFRIGEAAASVPQARPIDGAVSQLRATAARMAAPSAVVKSPAKASGKASAKAPGKAPAMGNSALRPARKAVSRGGFALDMSEGDEHDADFARRV
ncbi:chemotaxis protein, partial [Methylobacterium aquaticum]